MPPDLAHAARITAKKALYYGHHRHCPVCDSGVRRFKAAGLDARPDARCPVCGAVERHRLLWVFFERRTNLLDETPKRMLHIAPEFPIERRLRGRPGLDYMTADLANPRAMVQMDITSIDLDDDSFDVVHNSHVLEHIVDDAKAIAELKRVLKPNGWMTVQVPITVARTIEDATITDPAERLRRFGQEDHVRRYGPDVEDRIRATGFAVERVEVADVLNDAEAGRYAVPPSEVIFYCTQSN